MQLECFHFCTLCPVCLQVDLYNILVTVTTVAGRLSKACHCVLCACRWGLLQHLTGARHDCGGCAAEVFALSHPNMLCPVLATVSCVCLQMDCYNISINPSRLWWMSCGKHTRHASSLFPVYLQVDCYNISLVPVKTVVDEQLKRLQETLVASLRRKVRLPKRCLAHSSAPWPLSTL